MKNKKVAGGGFTLPEILIALVVIGIIAIITISIITENARKTEIETKLKKTVSVLNGAIYKASLEHGQVEHWPEINNNADCDIIAEKYIAPNLVTLKPIKEATLQELGYQTGIKTPNGGNYTRSGKLTDKKTRIFLNDGTVLLNISYLSNQFEYDIDINGPKGPNIAGHDVFQIAIDKTRPTPIARMLAPKTNIQNDYETGKITAEDNHKNVNNFRDNACGKTGIYCGWLIERNSWKIPDDYPLKI